MQTELAPPHTAESTPPPPAKGKALAQRVAYAGTSTKKTNTKLLPSAPSRLKGQVRFGPPTQERQHRASWLLSAHRGAGYHKERACHTPLLRSSG